MTDSSIDIDPGTYKILIVDDVVSNIVLLKALLKSENYQLATATSGEEALEQIKNGESLPDLILLDVMMPGISGFDLAKLLKSDEQYKEMPIIFLTALNGVDDIVKGFQLGANDFITKPFNKAELLIRINHQIALIAAKRIILRRSEELRNTILGRDRLYSVIANDLRTPLGSIKMVLNLMMNAVSSKDIGNDMFDMLSTANRTTEDVFTLLDNLLKWTKSQVGRLNVAFMNVDLVGIVKDGMDIFTAVSEAKNIKIELTTPPALEVFADADMVKTVVRNIISNAVKFGKKGGIVKINITDDGDFAVVSVTDDGCGIKTDDKEKLFHLDTHFSTFGTNNEEGAGLGLLLCHDFVTKNGGRLWFDSEEGKGSTFSFSLPKHKPS